MMAPFRVAIVGGGMTGLTAALHLDRLNIDFILLEAYNDITPEVGASLALYPNFQRVLDQLGVLEEAFRQSADARVLIARDLEGKPMFKHYVADGIRDSADGYGLCTWTRSQLLRILHDALSKEGKRKIHTGQRVKSIEQLPGDEGVRLHMEAGEAHEADVVIGADGTHSIVRSEMWRMAEEAGSKAFVNDKGQDAATEFGAVFGLSTNTGDLVREELYQVTGQDMTIGIFGGVNGEAFWFIFFKAGEDKVTDGLSFPKWTQEEGEQVCKKFANAKITEKTTFGDVFANRYRMTPQPCPNHCLRKWHFGRLICLGDSVAKTNPILAQGGAQGAESVLMLIDRLHDALKDRKEGVERLPAAKVESVLTEVNAKREPRVRAAVVKSQQLIRISAWSTWLYRIVGKWLTPLVPTWLIVAQALGQWQGAYQSTSLPAPRHPRREAVVEVEGAGVDKKGGPAVMVKPVPETSSEA